MAQTGTDFNAIRISLASPEQMRAWSYGEVKKPETINYRSLRPEKDGLFCERIFGPTNDWECACGKYRKIGFRGIKCERCGVEVTRARVRRERMGHIELAAPVAHIWLSKGTPSRVGLLMGLSPRNLERVLYFAQYIIISINEQLRQETLGQLKGELEKIPEPSTAQVVEVTKPSSRRRSPSSKESAGGGPAKLDEKEQARLDELQTWIDELEELRPLQILTEARHRELKERYPGIFRAGMGAESVLEILKSINLDQLREELVQEMRTTTGQRRRKAIKRLRLVEAFRKSGNKPEWMILTVLPVLPPDLRPMVQLDGGRFATSDLNDLYRRVINRNNRLKRLLELEAPEIIVRNEKRMLQEAVDALIDNGRRGRAIAGAHNHRLKSLSDLLRGKQGRFRQNLLGKRVDYSGRSVIVVGPELRMTQCGLPKRMALELFKPFILHRLVLKGFAHNIKSAKRIVERSRPEVWEVLEEVIKDRPVLLNRAPTLHRPSIQAFMPVLIEGSAVQIHPLVCTAFNADFDGDQMAVHVPLSRKAVLEARNGMLSLYNMLSPASGEPLVTPTLDMVLGLFYLTTLELKASGSGRRFASFEEARLVYDLGGVDVRAEVQVRDISSPDRWLKTTVGRIIFRDILPPEIWADTALWNRQLDKKALKEIVAQFVHRFGNQRTSEFLDAVKQLGFHFATVSGTTIAIEDLQVAPEKEQILNQAQDLVRKLDDQYQLGLITEEERYKKAIEIWQEASDEMEKLVTKYLPSYGGIFLMATSGAKGNISQIKQMVGMRGLMSNPKGRIIELPIKASFREGLSVLEYFISTHGARKGLADTALRTADSGYLTRRMVDVTQDVIVFQEDCGTTEGIWLVRDLEKEKANYVAPINERIAGRIAAEDVHDSAGHLLVKRNDLIDDEMARKIMELGIQQMHLRSPLSCEARRGVCAYCYGRSPATGHMANMGDAIGIVAAQSIGEPGTQLTMRTFHTGGVAGIDITTGLPRVEELFEARVPKSPVIISEIDGVVHVDEGPDGRRIRIISEEEYREEYKLPPGSTLLVSEGSAVEAGTILAIPKAIAKAAKKEAALPQKDDGLVAGISGTVRLNGNILAIVWQETEERVYPGEDRSLPVSYKFTVQQGDQVKAGQVLATGARGPDIKNPHDILRIQGKSEVQRYILEEVQKVYRAQGVSISELHIEIIIRQMLSKVRIEQQGDTEFLPSELVDKALFQENNTRVLAEGGEPATATPVLQGITRRALLTDSFLAAASFQETTRVLTEAAVNGAVDHLYGLKENVIIGRLTTARMDLTEDGRKRLDLMEEMPPSISTSESLAPAFSVEKGEDAIPAAGGA
ncbi:MAG: DNA-directed RNA polymerase subunit beta' [Chloroflexi bacterium]|nr:DNA-directed RNA polymerase subunit beta' [Chloroflexota bacterium]